MYQISYSGLKFTWAFKRWNGSSSSGYAPTLSQTNVQTFDLRCHRSTSWCSSPWHRNCNITQPHQRSIAAHSIWTSQPTLPKSLNPFLIATTPQNRFGSCCIEASYWSLYESPYGSRPKHSYWCLMLCSLSCNQIGSSRAFSVAITAKHS